jgi:hypothetical protein
MLAYLDTLIGFAIVMLVISLLITILTQMVSGLLNHRGSNLLWGLKTLFANIDPKRFPKLTENAERVAHGVLTHCMISDSWFSGNKIAQSIGRHFPLANQLFTRFQLATAIRPGELRDILQHLASNTLAENEKELAAEIQKLLGITQVTAVAAAALGQQGAANAITGAGQTVQNTVVMVEAEIPKLEDWFNSIMDRVSEKFVMYMRIWTVAFAATFALVTGLNSVSLISELYSNGAFRNALVGAGQQVINSADKVLDAKNSLGAKYVEVLKQALAAANVSPMPQLPGAIPTPVEVHDWIAKNVPAAQQADVQAKFDGASVAASQEFIQTSVTDASRVSAIASTAGFDVLKYRWPPKPSAGYIFGVLATAGLLSLGAPFWFNALKGMTNLRSVVAAKQDSEQAAG